MMKQSLKDALQRARGLADPPKPHRALPCPFATEKRPLMFPLLPLALACLMGGAFAVGAEEPQAGQLTPGDAQQKAALMKTAQAFVEAFQKGDAKAVAAFWTPDGDYVDPTGRRLQGRKAIEEAFATFFAENKGLQLRIEVGPVRFLTPDLAIEDGTTAVIPPDGAPPSRARYTNVQVQNNGQWSLASVREAAVDTLSPNHERLRGLEWALGDQRERFG